jgi:hypothetical protein
MVDDGWIVEGAVALLARDLGVRASKDVDVYREGERALALVEAELRRASRLDIGDWFRFDVGPAQAVSNGASGVRLPISAYIGDTVWAGFHVDLVGADIRMTGQPEECRPSRASRCPPLSRADIARTHWSITSRTRWQRPLMDMARTSRTHPPAFETWSTLSQSRSVRQSQRTRRSQRSGPKQSGAALLSRQHSTCPIGHCGNAAMRRCCL